MDETIKKYTPVAVTALLFLISLILCLCKSTVAYIFSGLTAIGAAVTVAKMEDNWLHWTKLCWPVLPLIQWILMLFAKGNSQIYSALFSSYSLTGSPHPLVTMSRLFAVLGVSVFLSLIGFHRAWNVRTVLITGVALIAAHFLFSVLGFEALMIVTAGYLCAIALFGFVYIRVYICNIFRMIARDKGYDNRCYFWLPFLCSLFGMLIVIALPNKRITDLMARMIPAESANAGTYAQPKYTVPVQPAMQQAPYTAPMQQPMQPNSYPTPAQQPYQPSALQNTEATGRRRRGTLYSENKVQTESYQEE